MARVEKKEKGKEKRRERGGRIGEEKCIIFGCISGGAWISKPVSRCSLLCEK